MFEMYQFSSRIFKIEICIWNFLKTLSSAIKKKLYIEIWKCFPKMFHAVISILILKC